MTDLVGRVTAALRNPGDSPWLPGLTAGLAESGWENLYHDAGFTPSEYGTERVLARDRNAPRQIISVIPASLDDTDSARVFQIELLGVETARRYEESGVRFYSEDEIVQGRMTQRIEEAVNILKSIPTLFKTVAELVRSAHLIDVGDDDYDVSFSEPHIPFSIFVSIPRNSGSISVLRVAEAIVHEAMHLQLTLVERMVPLVIPSSKKYFSPWRGEYRSLQGILHALYVFRVIDRFLEVLMLTRTALKGSENYLYNRRSQISDEIKQVKLLQDCPYLTSCGSKFAQALLVI